MSKFDELMLSSSGKLLSFANLPQALRWCFSLAGLGKGLKWRLLSFEQSGRMNHCTKSPVLFMCCPWRSLFRHSKGVPRQLQKFYSISRKFLSFSNLHARWSQVCLL